MLDHLIADESVTVGESQKSHELVRAARRPIGLDDLTVTEPDAEAAEHLDPDLVWRWLHDRARPPS